MPGDDTVGLAALLVMGTAACGGDDDDTAAEGSADPAEESAGEFPVTIENCGTETTYDAPPD